MADQVIGFQLSLNSGDKAIETVKSFKTQIREAKEELLQVSSKFGDTSTQAANAAKKVAELNDKIGDAKALTDAFNPDRKFQAFSTAIRGAATGFTALQGAMGLFGSESQDVQKTLLKVQSALAFSEGLNGLMGMKDGFKVMKTVAVDAFQKIKAAISSTGIGLLVVAVGTLVAYWDDIKAAVTGVSDEQERQAEQAQKAAEASAGRLKDLEQSDNILRLMGKSEKEILALKIEAAKVNLRDTQEHLAKRKVILEGQIQAEERNRKVLRGMLDFVGGGINIILKGVDAIGKVLGKKWGLSDKLNDWIADKVFNPTETRKKADEELKVINDSIKETENKIAGFKLNIKEIDKKAAADSKAAAEKAAAEEEARRKDAVAKFMKEYEDKQQAVIAYNKWLAQTEESERKAREEAEATAAKKAEERSKAMHSVGITSGVIDPSKQAEQLALMQSLLLTESELKLAALDDEYQKKRELIAGNEALEMQLLKQYEDQKTMLAAQSSKQRLDVVANVLGAAADLVGKQTAAGKAMAIAEATINMWTGATLALREKSTLPQPFSTIQKIASVAAIVGSGLKSIKEIAKTKVPGGGGGSAPSISPEAPISPQAQSTMLNQAQVNQIGNAAAGGVGRAYVLDADIRNAGQRDARIRRAATLG